MSHPQTSNQLRAFVALALVGVLTACGGKDDDNTCTSTADVFPVTYEPGVSNGAGYSRLSYAKGTGQTWRLASHGTSSACSVGLEVRAVSALPSGYSLEAATGAISRDASATGQSGFCVKSGQIMTEWADGQCPADQTPVANGYVIEVRSATTNLFALSVSFEPAT